MKSDDLAKLRRQIEEGLDLPMNPLRGLADVEPLLATAIKEWGKAPSGLAGAEAHLSVRSLERLASSGPSVRLVEALRKDLSELKPLNLAFARTSFLEQLNGTQQLLDLARSRFDLAMDPLLDARLRVTKVFGARDWAIRAKDIVESFALSNTAFRSLAGLETIAEMSRHSRETMAPSQELSTARSLGAELNSVAKYLDAAQLSLGTIATAGVGKRFSPAGGLSEKLGRATFRLAHRHAEFMTSLGRTEGSLDALPRFAVELPAISMFAHSQAIRGATPHRNYEEHEGEAVQSVQALVTEETRAFVEATLLQLKPAFVQQYRGATARVRHKGPDWWTQGASSMRKLFKGVLHTVAPDARVRPWAKEHGKAFDRLDRPTRVTKVDWLCAFVVNDQYRRVVHADVTSALLCLGMLDASQHVDEYPEFEDEYNLILLRVEVAIRHILKIWLEQQR